MYSADLFENGKFYQFDNYVFFLMDKINKCLKKYGLTFVSTNKHNLGTLLTNKEKKDHTKNEWHYKIN